MENYVLAQSWEQGNIQANIWYCMADADIATLKTKEKIVFGDKVYVINTKKTFIMGNDDVWYEM